MAPPSLPLPLLLLLLFFFCAAPVLFPRSFASAEAPVCPRSDLAFVDGLKSQCPRWIELASTREVDGESLDRELSHGESDVYYSVLFYASSCPFSGNVRPIFYILSSMFPQIKHLLVEESSMMPRYGIHSFPAIMLFNRTAAVRYHGAKDLRALVQFYNRTTGFDPIAYLVIDQPNNSGNVRSLMHQAESLRELITKEPFVVLGVVFICLKLVLSAFPIICSLLKALWVSHAWHLNLRVLCESSLLLVRVLHVIGVKKVWSKLKLGNKREEFEEGGKPCSRLGFYPDFRLAR